MLFEASSEFPNEVKLKREDGTIISLTIKYQWRPLVCSSCKVFGHCLTNCGRNRVHGVATIDKKVWIPKYQDIVRDNHPQKPPNIPTSSVKFGGSMSTKSSSQCNVVCHSDGPNGANSPGMMANLSPNTILDSCIFSSRKRAMSSDVSLHIGDLTLDLSSRMMDIGLNAVIPEDGEGYLSTEDRFIEVDCDPNNQFMKEKAYGKKGKGKNKKVAPNLGFTPLARRKETRITSVNTSQETNKFALLLDPGADNQSARKK